jgi:signal transduction histidine kinase
VPVSTISAAAQSLEMILTGSGDIVDSRLARIRRSISRITELLDQFFNQERLKENSFAPRQEPVDLAKLARDVVANMQPDAAHSLIVEAGEPIIAWCDRALCGVVLRNLLYNAIKYSPANQPVYVRVFFADDAGDKGITAMSVIDRGPGIDAQDLERIFDPHYRRPSHREVKGMGIGLYLARRICQNQGGSLTVTSEPGHGACFTITLPAPEKRA